MCLILTKTQTDRQTDRKLQTEGHNMIMSNNFRYHKTVIVGGLKEITQATDINKPKM